MKKAVALMAGNEVFAYLAFFLILAGGIFASFSMKKEVMPSFSVDVIQVSIPYPGATPEEIEEGICLKIEEAIDGIEGIKKYDSIAQEGVGQVFIYVEEGYDTDNVKDKARDRISAVNTFPKDAENPSVSEISTRSDVLELALYGNLPEEQLKKEAENIKEELRRLPEVTQVRVSGVREYEISIEVSENVLRRFGITLEQVAQKVKRECLNIPGGSVWTRGEEFKIRTMGRRYRGEEFRNIEVMAGPDGTLITLGEIADIRDSFEDDPVSGMFNGKRAALITVSKTEEEDAIAISEIVKEYVEQKVPALPPSLNLTLWSDYSRLIQDRLDLLLGNGKIGFLLVLATLWLFLGLRLGFWVAMGIPISLAGALVVMATTGQTVNMISLFALIMTLGIIVDDAIVVGEAIYVHRLEGKPPFVAAVSGVVEVFWPIVGAVTTSIVAFLPLFFVSGIMGKFIGVLPVAVVSALVFSLFECLFLLPAHLNHLPDLKQDRTRRSLVKRAALWFRTNIENLEQGLVKSIYIPLVRLVLRWRYVTCAAAISIMMVMIGVKEGGLIKFVLFPKADTDFLITRIEFPAGTPIEVTQGALKRIEQGLHKAAERFDTRSGEEMILHVYSMVGSYSGYDIQMGSHLAEVKTELLPSERRGVFFKEINAAWAEEVGSIEGALSVSYDTIEHGPPGKPIEIWFLGDDYDDLRAAANVLKDHLGSKRGVNEIEDDYRPGKTEIRVRLKETARSLGLSLNDVGLQMRHGWHGNEPVRIQRGRDDIRVKVRYPAGDRKSLADLKRIRIHTPSGAEIPLTTVADLSFEKGLTVIKRNDGQRRVAVTADVNTDIANSNEIMTELAEKYIPNQLKEYPGVTFSIEGEQYESQRSVKSLFKGFFFAIFAIFLILATIFRSYIQPLVIMVTVPFGLIGAVLGHMVFGLDLTILSLFSLVALTGIVVNDAIVLIESINSRIGEGVPFFTALAQGGKRRFRAIVLTTITTCAGLMPIIVERSVQAQYLIPMAISICCGVFFASFLTLLLVPCLMGILNDVRVGLYYLWHGRVPRREELEPGTKRKMVEERVNSA